LNIRRFSAILSTCFVLFYLSIKAATANSQEMMSLGIGAVDPALLIYGENLPPSGVKGIIINTLVANSPQAILSGVYYAYNALFTCFMLGAERNSFAR
jgi:hypothetical protein